MKKRLIIAILLVVAFSIGIGSAFAENSLQQGKVSVSVGMGDSVFSHKTIPTANGIVNDVVDINARYFINKDLAIEVGFGQQADRGDADANYISISGGVRKYLKTTDFAPFVSGQLTIAKVTANTNGDKTTDMTIIDLAGLLGAEYFVNKQFSLEGTIGIGLGQAKDGIADTTDTYLGTRTVGIKANFYF